MQIMSFDKEKGTVGVRFQFRRPLAPQTAPTRGPADDEPIPSICVYVPKELSACLAECGRVFERGHSQDGAVRVDTPRIPMLGLVTEKGIGITDWRPEKARHQWMEPLRESALYPSRQQDEGSATGKITTYHLYHWLEMAEGEAAILEWLEGAEAKGTLGRHGFSLVGG